MCEQLRYFQAPQGRTVVALPFDLDEMLAQWAALRTRMIRHMSPAFTREEWGYLITFLDRTHLQRAFIQAFGAPTTQTDSPLAYLARPRGPIALWLPNNVSLLGPLTLILLTLTGNRIHIKGGSTSEDLVGPFLAYVREHAPGALLPGYLAEHVRYEIFGRSDPRNQEMAAAAKMRVVFGSDDAARAIDALPHPLDSVAFAFSDRTSEVWVEQAALSDEVLIALNKVFAIYGRAGCTSPARVVLLNEGRGAAVALRDRLLALWPDAVGRSPAAHVASGNIMARQWAAGAGWDAALTRGHGATLAVGHYALPPVAAPMFLPIVAATREEAVAHLPANIQTLGHAVSDPEDTSWMRLLAQTRIKRFVPLARMHHFGPVWDGEGFWKQAFEIVEIGGKS